MEFLPQIPSTLWITSMMNVLQMDSHAIKRNACGGNGNSFVTTPPVAPTKHKIWKSSSLLTTTDITPTHNSTWPWLETVARFSLIPQDIFEPFSGSVTRITTRKTDPSSWTCVCPGIRTTSLSSLIPMGMVLYRETRDTWKFIEREIWFNGSSRLAAPLLWILQGFPSPGPRRNVSSSSCLLHTMKCCLQLDNSLSSNFFLSSVASLAKQIIANHHHSNQPTN
mmetsp:Transcript_20800/g.48274  ORF Transcript_20800/g.48274 Transcript_20800/m.48274 type:complete len:223 (-) Transcript_20800:1142-1810(-)